MNKPTTQTINLGCNSDTSNISLTQPTAINLNLSSTPESDTGYFDGTATVNINGGTPPYTILWSNSQTDSTIVYLSTGIYSVTVTDANGCFISDSVFVESFVGINQNSQLFNSYIYPNPCDGSFSVIANYNIKYDAIVFDMCGRLMYSKYNCYGENDFNLNLSSGNYVLKLTTDDKIVNLNLSVFE